jgi:hypothetical protein
MIGRLVVCSGFDVFSLPLLSLLLSLPPHTKYTEYYLIIQKRFKW